MTGAKLASIEADGQRATLTLMKDEKPYALQLELSAPPAVFLTLNDRILAVTSQAPVPERPGQVFLPRGSTAPEGTLRLKGDAPDFPLAHAAETLLATNETARAVEAAKSPVLGKIARLLRTRKKVEAEAARTPLAARYRQDGDLLKQHLHDVPRGAREVTLTEYQADGTIADRTIPLEPSRTAQQHAEWLFHQYRRLTRGAELSRQRLAQLDAEHAKLVAQLAQVEAAPPTAPPKKKHELLARPYREYLAAGGARIWVGKGSGDNDTLSFKLSRPHFLWLHARGVPGAHVVIPLERGTTAPQELLLDAAHLALHHSDFKGEPRGEVSYVPVKHLRKVKGAPGAVTFSQEKTFVLRVEPARLKRLLSSEQ